MDDTHVDEDKCCLLSLLPSFRQFNDEQKFLARMEILKIMRHLKLQQNLNTHSSCSLPSFSNANSFFPNSLHSASNPLNPQPVTSGQNSEILSRYLPTYSVDPQRPPTSTTALYQYHISPKPISSNAPLLLGEDGSSDVSLSYLLVQQRICKLNFFLSFFYTNFVTSVILVYLTESDI